MSPCSGWEKRRMPSMVKDVPLVSGPSEVACGVGMSNPCFAPGVSCSATLAAAPSEFDLNSINVTGGEKLFRYFTVTHVEVSLRPPIGGHRLVRYSTASSVVRKQ